ncbi:MAG: hypothetical protein LBI38_01740 [Oscillospiraceae bacterium]|jgi:hypothetical protein|nr:hypothetical protein [Oscillospiraceae bacterium]
MRRIVFIVLIVLVAAVTGFFCWREFAVPDIAYVADFPDKTAAENHFALKRLYVAVVDEEAFADALSGLTMTEFTEDEMMTAALAAGNPEFYPVFYYSVYKEGDEIRLSAYINIELAEKQTQSRFTFGKADLEAVAQGLTIDEVAVVPVAGRENEAVKSIVSEDKTQMAVVDFDKASSFEITLGGSSGTVTLRYVYSVAVDTFLDKIVLEDQLAMVHANISTDEKGNVSAEFINEPYSSLDDLDGGAA